MNFNKNKFWLDENSDTVFLNQYDYGRKQIEVKVLQDKLFEHIDYFGHKAVHSHTPCKYLSDTYVVNSKTELMLITHTQTAPNVLKKVKKIEVKNKQGIYE